MGSIADYLEDALLDHIFNGAGVAYSPVATVYLGLSTADPGDDAAGLAEPSGNGYVRKAITFDAAASRLINQTSTVTFDQASGSWGTLTHYGIFDASTAGNMLAHGALSTSKTVVSGNTPSVDAGEVDVEFYILGSKGDTTNNISDYLADKLLDFAFRNQAFAQPDTYIALCDTNVGDADTGTTISEPAAGAYARKQVNDNGGASPTWDLVSSGIVDNTHDIDFVTPTASWGLITAIAIVDALTVGNLLFFDNDITDQTPTTDDTVRIPVGDFDNSLI